MGVVARFGWFQKLLISWKFYTKQALEFTHSGAKNKKKHPVYGGSAERNTVLREIRGEKRPAGTSNHVVGNVTEIILFLIPMFDVKITEALVLH